MRVDIAGFTGQQPPGHSLPRDLPAQGGQGRLDASYAGIPVAARRLAAELMNTSRTGLQHRQRGHGLRTGPGYGVPVRVYLAG